MLYPSYFSIQCEPSFGKPDSGKNMTNICQEKKKKISPLLQPCFFWQDTASLVLCRSDGNGRNRFSSSFLHSSVIPASPLPHMSPLSLTNTQPVGPEKKALRHSSEGLLSLCANRKYLSPHPIFSLVHVLLSPHPPLPQFH